MNSISISTAINDVSNIVNNNIAQPIFPTYPSIPIILPDTNSTACQTVCYNEGICNITQCQVHIFNTYLTQYTVLAIQVKADLNFQLFSILNSFFSYSRFSIIIF